MGRGTGQDEVLGGVRYWASVAQEPDAVKAARD